MLKRLTLLYAPLLVWMVILAPGREGRAQSNNDPYRVTGGFGHDGCAANPGFDVSGATPVQAGSGVVQCASGFGQIEASAGPGTLHASSQVHHTGFGTASSGGAIAKFRVPFQVLSGDSANVPVSMNLLLTSTLTQVVPPGGSPPGFALFIRAQIDSSVFASGMQSASGGSGMPIPLSDGVTHPFVIDGVMVTPNFVHFLDVDLEVSSGSASFDTQVALSSTLTLPTTGLVFNVPDGVTVSDIPELNVVNNHWTTPQVPPNPGIAIDMNTAQSFLDGLFDAPASIGADGTGRTSLNLPHLANVGCALTVTNNPLLTSLTVPLLNSIGCSLIVSHNPRLNLIDVPVATTVGGDVVVTGNDGASLTRVSVGASVGGSVTLADASSNTIEFTAGTSIGGGVSVTDGSSNTIEIAAGTSIGGDVTMTDNSASSSITLRSGTDVEGDLAVTDNTSGSIGLTVGGRVAGDLSLTGNASESIDVQIGDDVSGDVAIENNSGADTVNAGIVNGVRGDVTVVNNGDAAINIDTPNIEGDVVISGGSGRVSATTGDGTTQVTLTGAPATMTVLIPNGAFSENVRFSVETLVPEPPSQGVTDGSSNTIILVEPIAEYRFSFDIRTLNVDATLTFDIDVASLGGGTQTFLDALAANHATLAVRGDAPGSVFQAFSICGQGSAGAGCVNIARFDAMGALLAEGDPAVPAMVRFTGVTGHFSTFAVVLVTHPAPTVPVINAVPGPQGTAPNLPLLFSSVGGNPIAVSGAATLRVTLTATPGTLTLRRRAQLTFVTGNGIADTAMTFTGSLGRINAALDGLIFVPRLGFRGVATLTIQSGNASGGMTDSDTVAITVGARADLAVTVTDAPDPVTTGANLTYMLQLTNNGPFDATTVTLVDVLPAGVTFVSAGGSQGACSYQAVLRTVRCDMGALPNRGSAQVTVVVITHRRTTLLNHVFAASNQFDPNLTNNKVVAATVVR